MKKYLLYDDQSEDQTIIEARSEKEAMTKALEWARISVSELESEE